VVEFVEARVSRFTGFPNELRVFNNPVCAVLIVMVVTFNEINSQFVNP
jgi:hypothetical protein